MLQVKQEAEEVSIHEPSFIPGDSIQLWWTDLHDKIVQVVLTGAISREVTPDIRSRLRP